MNYILPCSFNYRGRLVFRKQEFLRDTLCVFLLAICQFMWNDSSLNSPTFFFIFFIWFIVSSMRMDHFDTRSNRHVPYRVDAW
jgi:hypothetical protein